MRSWLLDETSDAKAVEVIRRSEILRLEAEAAIPELRAAATRPADAEEVERIVQSRFPLFPQPQRTAAEWAMWWAEYHDALEGLTPSAIEAGMRAWVKLPEAEFLPKPGKLAELARSSQVPNKWSRAAHRALKATEATEEEKAVPQGERIPPEQFAKMHDDLMKSLAAAGEKMRPTPKHPPRPRYTPPVDEHGVTPEMREFLSRQC